MTCKPILFLIIFFSLNNILSAQIGNGSFELWPDSLVQNNVTEDFIDSGIDAIPLEWVNPSESNTLSAGFYRTTDAVSGDYAVVLYTWYGHVQSTLTKMDTITKRPFFLGGMYKYLLKDDFSNTTDVATASILVFNALGDTIGTGQQNLHSVSSYSPFLIPIEYKNNDAVFSYYITFKSSKDNCGPYVGVCKYLFLDDVKFDFDPSTNLSVEKEEINIFPNPSNGIVNFSKPFRVCYLYNLQRNRIQIYKEDNKILLPESSGVYILRITSHDGTTSIQKVQKIN